MSKSRTRVRRVVMRCVAAVGLIVMGIGMVWSGQSYGAERLPIVVAAIGVVVFVVSVPFCGLGRRGRASPDG